jgi:predicted DNA-binding WGR domain protein
MPIHSNLEVFDGRKVVDFAPGEDLPDPSKTAVRLGVTMDTDMPDGDEDGSGDGWERYEFNEDSSNKFWEVQVQDGTMTVRYGKIGTSGQVKEKTFADAAAAEKEKAKLVREKTGKGYEPAEPGDSDDEDGEELELMSEVFVALFKAFFKTKGIEKTQALVIGNWAPEEAEPVDPVITALVANAKKLKSLTALFIGDITSEENEISWIEQGDLSELWGAFPKLQTFAVRGGQNLSLGEVKHKSLKSLVVQTGGLSSEVVRQIAAADLPALEHLEIWFGTENYGGNSGVGDIAGILDGKRFPKLQTLALKNCEWADDLAAAVATSPILKRIKRLDLSMGTLSDAGADALAKNPAVGKLELIDIRHHYVSDEAVARLAACGVKVEAADRQEPNRDDDEEHRYVAVSE